MRVLSVNLARFTLTFTFRLTVLPVCGLARLYRFINKTINNKDLNILPFSGVHTLNYRACKLNYLAYQFRIYCSLLILLKNFIKAQVKTFGKHV